MDRKIVQVFYGAGKGKTSAAVGQCIRAASLGQSDRKSTRLNSSHRSQSRMPSSA